MSKLVADMLLLNADKAGIPFYGPSLSIKEKPRHSIVRIQAIHADIALEASILLGINRLPVPSEYLTYPGELCVVWTSQNEWLIFAPQGVEEEILCVLRGVLTPALGCVTSISDSRVCFEVHGADASAWLSKSCTFDTSPMIFRAGSATIARFNQQAALIKHVADQTYLIYFDAPLARYMSKVMVETAREFV
jgi:sarcosine oxidase subunit gamma